jgi:hypothetical protein
MFQIIDIFCVVAETILIESLRLMKTKKFLFCSKIELKIILIDHLNVRVSGRISRWRVA